MISRFGGGMHLPSKRHAYLPQRALVSARNSMHLGQSSYVGHTPRAYSTTARSSAKREVEEDHCLWPCLAPESIYTQIGHFLIH